MAFRKRNVIVPKVGVPVANIGDAQQALPTSGVRPSPVDGRPTISTGLPSLDGILAGHAGLPLGNSILIEENGTTDYSGALLRFFAAEGITQGHQVHVLGMPEQWGRDLPGLVGVHDPSNPDEKGSKGTQEKMKIAWRYEKLGESGHTVSGSRGTLPSSDASSAGSSPQKVSNEPNAFCHIFDLAKRLTLPPGASIINFLPIPHNPNQSPFVSVLDTLHQKILSNQNVVHRLIIPTILSPAFYPAHASQPHHLLQFFHSLRSLLRQFPAHLSALVTLPLELYPRSSGLVRWIEILSDGVLELAPFPHLMNAESALASSGAATASEERPQGMLHIHKLPVFHEKGGGGGSAQILGDDLAFTLSRRKFVIKPFSLPPVEGDTEAQQGNPEGGLNSKDLAF